MSILTKAIRIEIKLGDIPLNVYEMPNGSYKLAGRNVTDAIGMRAGSLSEKMGVKTLKALPHAGFDCPTIKANTGESFIPVAIEDAVAYWGIMARSGNDKAYAVLVACAIEAIERRADHARGIQVKEEERNERLKLRETRLLARRKWTDKLQQRHIELYGYPPSSDQFKAWTVAANLALFNRRHFFCDRDTMTIDEQLIIESFETLCCRKASQYPKDTPDEILQKVFAAF